MSTATTTTEDNRRAYGRRAHSTTPGKAPQLYITHWSGIFSFFDCSFFNNFAARGPSMLLSRKVAEARR